MKKIIYLLLFIKYLFFIYLSRKNIQKYTFYRGIQKYMYIGLVFYSLILQTRLQCITAYLTFSYRMGPVGPTLFNMLQITEIK